MQQAVVVFRIPQALLDALDAKALKLNIGRSDAFREAISIYTDVYKGDYNSAHGNSKYVNATEQKIVRRRQVARNVAAHRERKQNAI